MDLIWKPVDDIIRYDPELKMVAILSEGLLYHATVVSFGYEAFPRPDMYGALWGSSPNIKNKMYNEPFQNIRFSRDISLALLFPKTLGVAPSGYSSDLSKLFADAATEFTTTNGSSFIGSYSEDGSAYGMFTSPTGEILIKGSGGTVTIGKTGIVISADTIIKEGSEKSYAIFKKDPFSFIPSTAVTPLPVDMPDIESLDKIKGAITPYFNIG